MVAPGSDKILPDDVPRNSRIPDRQLVFAPRTGNVFEGCQRGRHVKSASIQKRVRHKYSTNRSREIQAGYVHMRPDGDSRRDVGLFVLQFLNFALRLVREAAMAAAQKSTVVLGSSNCCRQQCEVWLQFGR